MPRTADAGAAHLGEAVLRVDDEQTCLAASTCSAARFRPVRNTNVHDGVPSPTTTSFFFTSGLRAAILDDDGSIALAGVSLGGVSSRGQDGVQEWQIAKGGDGTQAVLAASSDGGWGEAEWRHVVATRLT
jgi:hypothetical protein